MSKSADFRAGLAFVPPPAYPLAAARRAVLTIGRHKTAAAYTMTGNVQGVGLRKTLHGLLEAAGLPGLAVNDPFTGGVHVTLPLDRQRRARVLADFRHLLNTGEAGGDYTITPSAKRVRLRPIRLDEAARRRMFERQGFTQGLARGDEFIRNWIQDRYRLQAGPGDTLVGDVSAPARRQLRGLEPIYESQVSDEGEYGYGPQYWQRKRAADAPALTTLVPRSAVESIRTHGLLGGQALAANPEALAAAAAGRDIPVDELRAAIADQLKGRQSHQALGPNAFIHLPPPGTALSGKHPTRLHDLTAVGIRLGDLLRDVPATRLYGMELAPYDAKKPTKGHERHRYLSAGELRALAGRSPADLWKDYADPDDVGYYAANVPHVSLHTPDAAVAAKYLDLPPPARSGG